MVKLSREELETLRKSYEIKIKEKEEKSLITYLSKKFNKNLRSVLPRLLKYEFIVFFIVMIFVFVFMAIAGFTGWISNEDFSTISMTIVLVPMLIIMIPLMATIMLMDIEKTSSDYTILDRINTILESKYNVYDRLISPETPFANELHYTETIKSCRDNIYLIDKYFNEGGLRLLNEGLKENANVTNVKIITSIEKATENLRNASKKIRDELDNRNIGFSLKICEKKVLTDIHDRYLITEERKFLLPSPDVIKRGQYASITGINQPIPFQKYWDKGLDIVDEWIKINEILERR